MAQPGTVSWRRQGGSKEGIIPSSRRHWRSVSWGSWQPHQRVEINYSKLRELCNHQTPQNKDRCTHDLFMTEYTSIFKKKPRQRSRSVSAVQLQRHSCCTPLDVSHNVSSYMIDIHGRNAKEQEIIDLESRLKAMYNIIKKLPIQRSSSEVRQLAQHLVHFPALLPNATFDDLTGVAARALGETMAKSVSLPGKGGVYLIIQGRVEKLYKDPSTGRISSMMLQSGECFGDLQMDQHFARSIYPTFVTCEPCALMRVTAFDYQRVVQLNQAASVIEKEKLVESCPLLHAVSPSVLGKLAEAIVWKSVPENSTLLAEGQTIEKVGFIQQGKCLAYAKIPNTSRVAQVCIGELGPGSCIGELLLRGWETQPYAVVTVTAARIGWVTNTVIKVNEVEKHILPESPLSVAVPNQEELRLKYANKLMDRQWNKMRHDIMSEVLVERGITHGHSKWKHSSRTGTSTNTDQTKI